MPVLDSLLSDCSKGEISLYTSDISRVEVAFAAYEKEQRDLDTEVERRIDSLWDNSNVFTMVEFHSEIAKNARAMMRSDVSRGRSLKPLDAIHLATAQWLARMGLAIKEFHTYDTRLLRYDSIFGFRVMEPTTINPTLF